MGNRAAVVRGVFLTPGVSKNKRLYTAENINKAVARMQQQLTSPSGLPLTMATSHGAAYNDDALSMVGRVTSVFQDEEGKAHFEADIANTSQGRDVATLIEGKSPFLKSISIRGEWLTDPKTVEHEGQEVVTADDFGVSGIDFTSRPGVLGANIEDVERVNESANLNPHMIFESFTEFEVSDFETPREAVISVLDFKEKFSEFIESLEEINEADSTPYGDVAYADPGYQADKKKRYPINTEAHVRAAWSYINQGNNASQYSAAQLKRIKGRIKSAAKKYNIDIKEEYNQFLNELQEIIESWVGITVDNGPATISVNGQAADPTQLRDLINQLAATATAALTVLDPDQDGDIDNVDIDDVDYKSSDSDEEPIADILRHDKGHDEWHAMHGDPPCKSEADCAAMRARYKAEAEIKKTDDNNMEGVPSDAGDAAMFCSSCNYSLPDGVTACPECGESIITKESQPGDSTETKEALVADTENVAEAVTDEVPEVPARSLTEADLKALAGMIAEATAAAISATQVKEEEEAPAEEPEAAEEVPEEEPEAAAEETEVEAAESTQEGDMAESYSAEDLKKAVAEALDTFKEEVTEAYRENGAPRKGLVSSEVADEDVEESFSAERLAKMGTKAFRESQYEAWSNVPFFQQLWGRADGNQQF